MKSYGEIIEEQRKKLNKNINWWPLYFYHFTNILNAISIIEKEYIYGRKSANDEKLMTSDNASSRVIEITNEGVERYARLYMRPKTPTQFHNEGHKPEHIRNQDINANCPVPIFFFLDAEKTLSMDGVQFVEKGLAGSSYGNRSLFKGVEKYADLNFEKIFHDGPFPSGSEIKQFRHTEIVREDGISISGIIRGIACRSVAEKQTLLYLLKKNSKDKYYKYKDIISYKPDIDIFYNNGIFIKTVRFEEDTFYFELNDSSRRYNTANSNGKDVAMKVNIDWLGDNMEILGRSSGSAKIDYGKTTMMTYRPNRKVHSNNALIEVKFDECLMYESIMQIDEFEIV